MPITDSYETAANYRAVIDKTDAGEDGEVLIDLTAVSRWMEKELGRFFTKDAAAVARDFFAPVNTRTLLIDDLSAAPTSVVIDDNNDGTPSLTFAATDYELLPRNALKGPEPSPYTSLYLPGWTAQSEWNSERMVRITGQWGWPAVPEAIKRACIHLTAILRLETPRAQSAVTELGQVVQSSPQARGIIDRLMREYSRKAVLV